MVGILHLLKRQETKLAGLSGESHPLKEMVEEEEEKKNRLEFGIDKGLPKAICRDPGDLYNLHRGDRLEQVNTLWVTFFPCFHVRVWPQKKSHIQ